MQIEKKVIKDRAVLVNNLAHLIEKGNAHTSLDNALKNIPFSVLAEKPANLPYSIWQLAEHIRIAQWDILEFSRNPQYISPKWPEGYWPEETGPASEAAWDKCLDRIKSDRAAFVELIKNAGDDLEIPFEHGDGQSLLKETLVLADHNSYHAGEIIILRRLLNEWDSK